MCTIIDILLLKLLSDAAINGILSMMSPINVIRVKGSQV